MVNDMQNAVELAPAGQVRHLVTTYTTSPAVQGSSTHRLEQWFGTVDGRPVSRQTGLLGETTVLDASGTGWQSFARSNQVIKLPNASASNFPALEDIERLFLVVVDVRWHHKPGWSRNLDEREPIARLLAAGLHTHERAAGPDVLTVAGIQHLPSCIPAAAAAAVTCSPPASASAAISL